MVGYTKKLGLSPLIIALSVVFWGVLAQSARAELDYADLIGRIDERLTGADAAYQQGDADTAKDAVQSAYFEIFENLEGPIRVNVSAARSYELEAEFGDIRKLIMQGAPPAVVHDRIVAQIAAIRAVLPDLESGVRLRGEPGRYENEEPAPEAVVEPAADQPIEPEWQAVVDGIGARIAEAAVAYEQGEAEQAIDLVLKAQFDGYKNSLLETAVRRYRSSGADAAINGEFTRIVGLIRDGRPARMVAASGKQMVVELTDLLPRQWHRAARAGSVCG